MKKVLVSCATIVCIVFCFIPASAAAADNDTAEFDFITFVLYSAIDGPWLVVNTPDSGLTPWQVIDITRAGPALFVFSDTGLTTGAVLPPNLPGGSHLPFVIFNIDGVLYSGAIDFEEDGTGFVYPSINGANRENGELFSAIKQAELSVSVSPKGSGSIRGTNAADIDDGTEELYTIDCGRDCEAHAHWNDDTQFTLTATPEDGYSFKHWDLAGTTLTENPVTITLDQYSTGNLLEGFGRRLRNLDKSVTAVFEKSDESGGGTAVYTCEIVSPAAGDYVLRSDESQQYRAKLLRDGADITGQLAWDQYGGGARGFFYIQDVNGNWNNVNPFSDAMLFDDGMVGYNGSSKISFDVSTDHPPEWDAKVKFSYDAGPDGDYATGECFVDITWCNSRTGTCD
jgi:hypothetical protein